MATVYTTGTTATLLRVSRETVRTYAEEFAQYLSPMAAPGDKRHRQFTEDDLKVLKLVADLKRNGRVYQEIHEALEDGVRGDMPDLSILGPPGGVTALTMLERRMNELGAEMQTVRLERDEARSRLLPLERENATNKALREQSEKRVSEMEGQVDRLNQEINRLNREIGKLEARLETPDD